MSAIGSIGNALPANIGVYHPRKVATPAAPVPAGSDPVLRSVLTAEETDFFARQAALGPITYGPTKSRVAVPMQADAPLGQRIDVRA